MTSLPECAPSTAIPIGAQPSRAFANPALVSRSWFPILRSCHLAPRGVRRVELARRRLVAYRDGTGAAHVLDARCPHLGADLAQGSVDGDGLRCAFHGWCFGPDGRCRDAPGHPAPPDRRTRAYPVAERWGLVWLFNGPEPLFPLPDVPDVPDGARAFAVRLPSQRIRSHPHLVLGNGLDVSHYEHLHGMRLTGPAQVTTGPFGVTVALRGRPASRLWQILSGSTSSDIEASFTTVGGSLAWASVRSPLRFDVLFSGRPHADGGCLTQTIFFLRRRPGAEWVRALGLMLTLLHDDRRVLERLEFRPAFTDADGPLRAYARVVDGLGTW